MLRKFRGGQHCGTKPLLNHDTSIRQSPGRKVLRITESQILLTRYEGDVKRSPQPLAGRLQLSYRFEVLDADTLHVLRAAREDLAVRVYVCAEGVVAPAVL